MLHVVVFRSCKIKGGTIKLIACIIVCSVVRVLCSEGNSVNLGNFAVSGIAERLRIGARTLEDNA